VAKAHKQSQCPLHQLQKKSKEMVKLLEAQPQTDETRRCLDGLSASSGSFEEQLAGGAGLGADLENEARRCLSEIQQKKRQQLRKRMDKVKKTIFLEVECLDARFLEEGFLSLLASRVDHIPQLLADLRQASHREAGRLRKRLYQYRVFAYSSG